MRLKQICNFDPATGESAKLEQLVADVQEVADNDRKAIVFSQWVQPPGNAGARASAPYGPMLYQRQGAAPRSREPIPPPPRPFPADRTKHVLFNELRHRQRRG